jgi:hypothetical protein
MMNSLKRAKGYKWIGQEMQRRESKVIIGTVCEHLRQQHPDAPILTVHDSIATTEAHLGTVKAALDAALDALPFRPSIALKAACPARPLAASPRASAA